VNGGSNSLQIFNVSTPSAPTLLSTTTTGSSPYSVAVSGNYAYVVNYSSGTLEIFNVSTPSAPTLASTTTTGSSPDSVAVSGDYAYVANNYSYSLQIFNVSILSTAINLTGNISALGNATFQSATNNASVFEIQNAAGNLLLNVNTSATVISLDTTNVVGGVVVSGLSTPGAPTITTVAGGGSSTTWAYEVVAVNGNGGTTPASTAGSISTSDWATLSLTNYNTISWSAVTGANSYKVYRTIAGGTPSTTGLIGTTTLTSFEDTGMAGDGTTPPTTDTSGQLVVGTSTEAGQILLQDGSNHAVTLLSATQSNALTVIIPSDTNSSDQVCLKTLANCGSGSGGVTTIGSLDGGTANVNGATISGSNLYLQSASGSYPGLVNTTTQTFAGSKTVQASASSTAFVVQGSSTDTVLTADTSANQVLLGQATYVNGQLAFANATNSYIITLVSGATTASYSLTLPTAAPAATGQCLGDPSSTTQLGYISCGTGTITGGHASNIVINAEYIGAALDSASDGSCSSSNIGTMTSGFYAGTSSVPPQNYFEWTTAQTTSQCYDVVVQVPLPSDFGSFVTSGNSFQIYGTNSSSTNSTDVAVEAIQCNAAADTGFGGGYVGISTGTSWAQTSISASSDSFTTANYTSCGYLTLKIRLTASSNSTVQIGTIDIPYITSTTNN
jgi:hypothetical protein